MRSLAILDSDPRHPDHRGCATCRYLVRQAPWIVWYECRARPANENLRGFPDFKRCKHWASDGEQQR